MKMLRLLFVSLIFLLSTKSYGVEVSFRTLRTLVEERNDKVLSQKKKIQAIEIQKNTLANSFLPTLSLNAGAESFHVGSQISKNQPFYGFEAEVNLFNGGRDQLNDELSNLSLEKQQTQVKVILAKELASARELFWRIAYHDEELRLLETMLKKNRNNLKATEKRIKSGVANPIDRLEFKMKHLDLMRDKMQIIAKRKTLGYDLLVRIGYSLNEPLTIKEGLEHLGEWEKELAHSHHKHDFFTKIYHLQVAELQLRSQRFKQERRPKIDLYAGWQQFTQFEKGPTEERERQNATFGIRLKLDLFDRRVSSTRAHSLLAKASAAESLSHYYERVNEAHIEKEFLDLRSLHALVHDAEKHIAMAENYYKKTKSEYARGAKNSPDVLGATEKLEQATRIKNQLLRDFHIARSHAMSKIGH